MNRSILKDISNQLLNDKINQLQIDFDFPIVG